MKQFISDILWGIIYCLACELNDRFFAEGIAEIEYIFDAECMANCHDQWDLLLEDLK